MAAASLLASASVEGLSGDDGDAARCTLAGWSGNSAEIVMDEVLEDEGGSCLCTETLAGCSDNCVGQALPKPIEIGDAVCVGDEGSVPCITARAGMDMGPSEAGDAIREEPPTICGAFTR